MTTYRCSEHGTDWDDRCTCCDTGLGMERQANRIQKLEAECASYREVLESIQRDAEIGRTHGTVDCSVIVFECHKALSLSAERDKWKDEYENVSKFATDYEQQRDALRAKLAESEGERERLQWHKQTMEDALETRSREHHQHLEDKLKLKDRLALAERVVETARRASCYCDGDHSLCNVAEALAAFDAGRGEDKSD